MRTRPAAVAMLACALAAALPAATDAEAAAPAPGTTLARSVAALERQTGTRMGVALTPVGRTGRVWRVGSLSTGPAWSTSKVPVAVANQQRHPGANATLLRRAITQSDNAAADQLYAQLGQPAVASRATQRVIRQAGDRTTVVPTRQTRAGYSIYGQTRWALAPQARFVADLTCHRDAAGVLRLMGQVSPDQRWGLGTLRGARFKGGWGPAPDGRYLVRQMGVVTIPGHRVDGRWVRPQAYGVAIAVDRTSFTRGAQLDTRLAQLVTRQAPSLPVSRC